MANEMKLTLKIDGDGKAAIVALDNVEKKIKKSSSQSSENIKQVKKNVKSLSKSFDTVKNAVASLTEPFKSFKSLATGAFAALGVTTVVKSIANTQRQFDVLNAQLITATGGINQAKQAFKDLTKFAAQTPYALEQSVEGFAKLKNLGLEPSMRSMKSYGNFASAMGKDLNQMIEAVADASTFEFERLKDFGIKASQQGDKVAFTFRGVTTTVAKNSADIQKYLLAIGETEFADAMANRMNTLDGAFSNLSDNFNALKLAISQQGLGSILNTSVRGLSAGIAYVTENLATLTKSFAVATIAATTFYATQSGSAVAVGISKIALLSRSLISYISMSKLATVAQRAFNFAIAANPIGFILTALTTAISYFTLFRNEIHPVTNSIATLADYATVAFRVIKEALISILPDFGKIKQAIADTYNSITGRFNGVLTAIQTGFNALLNFVKNAMNKYIGFWVGAYKAVIALFKNFPQALSGIITDALNFALEKINGFIRNTAEILNKLPGVNIDVKAQGFDKIKNNAKEASQAVYDAFNSGLNADYIGAGVDVVADKITLIQDKMANIGSSWQTMAEQEHNNNAKAEEAPSNGSELQNIATQATATTSALKSVKDQLQAIRDFKNNQATSLADYEFETSLIGLQADEVARLRYEYELDKQAQQAMEGLSAERVAQIKQETQAIKDKHQALVEARQAAQAKQGNDVWGGFKNGMNATIKNAGTAFDTMKKAGQNFTNSLTDGIANMVVSGKGSFKDLTKSILADIGKMLIKFALLRAIKGAMGMFADGGAFDTGGEMKLAKGGAFNAKGVKYYARGDIFNSPTGFVHAGGLGIMGEAGPEAVMPLTRGPNGKLGVQVYGGQKQANNRALGQVNNIDINVAITGQEASSNSQSQANDGKKLAESLEFAVRSVLMKEMRPGGLLNA